MLQPVLSWPRYRGPRRGSRQSYGTGRQVRAYPAAQFGGAVAASPSTTVVVGPHAVTSYATGSGAVRWSRPTGPPAPVRPARAGRGQPL